MIEVLPAILAHDENDFRSMILYPGLRECSTTVHVDILDGSLFDGHAWADPKVVGMWRHLPNIELHVMTERPLVHVAQWIQYVPSVVRAIIHAEINGNIDHELRELRQHRLEAGLAIAPATAIDDILAYRDTFDRLLLMGVEPGASGQQFLGEPILAKLRRARQLFPATPLALDGGVTLQHASAIIDAGARSLVASSAIWRHPEPLHACAQLVHIR